MHDNADASKILTASPLEERKRAPEACHLLFCYARYRKNSTVSKRQLSRIDTSQNLRCHGTLSKVMFIKKIEACLFAFICTRIKIKYNYNIVHINTEFVQKHKKFPSPLMPRCGRS